MAKASIIREERVARRRSARGHGQVVAPAEVGIVPPVGREAVDAAAEEDDLALFQRSPVDGDLGAFNGVDTRD